MKPKKEIVKDWITRYTGVKITSFGEYILLTNFQKYVDEFASLNGVSVDGKDKNMPSSTHNNITIINFGMGSPNAATVMDLLTAIMPKAVLFLGKCGALKNESKLEIIYYQLAQSEEKEHQMIIFQSKFQLCPPFHYKGQFLQL